MREVIVIGAGAAGLMAALTAAEASAKVTVLERNEKAGRKLYITGKGRCNCTNDCDLETFLKETPRNPRFLYSALTAFTPQDMMAFLEASGCPVTVQRGRRVYPASEKASDVTRALVSRCERAGVRFRYGERVTDLMTEHGRVTGARTEKAAYRADAVILATGGISYPATGSTGDGYRLAESVGHTTLPGRGVLVGLVLAEPWCAELMGLSLKNVKLTLREGKRVRWEELGELLFTHFGISGPLALTLSCHLPDDLSKARVTLDLKPGLDAAQLDARLVREFNANPRKHVASVLPSLLPGSLAAAFPMIIRLDGSKPCGAVTREERAALGQALKELPLTVRAPRPVEEAVVTRGGVSVKEIRPATMASLKAPGLYLAGEVIDVDAHTGGYNLQIAWSTGRAAGLAAATEETEMEMET